MARLLSNQLKTLLVMEDMLDNPMNVLRESCQVVQSFHYEARRKRNGNGDIYGPAESVLLDFTLRLTSAQQGRGFYAEMARPSHFPCSFLFNASFSENGRLCDYEDGLMVNGYVVDLREEFESAPESDGAAEQILLHVRMLVRNMTVLGMDGQNHYRMDFIR